MYKINKKIGPVTIGLVLLALAAPAGSLEVWVGSLPDYTVVCARTVLLNLGEPDSLAWSQIRDRWPNSQEGDLGASLVLPGPGIGELVPCIQYFGNSQPPADIELREIPGSRALFAKCPKTSSVPCFTRIRELLGTALNRISWSRPIMAWLGEDGFPRDDPDKKTLEALATFREGLREPPDSESVLEQLGVLLVYHLTQSEAQMIEESLVAKN